MKLSCELAWLGGEAAERGCPARGRRAIGSWAVTPGAPTDDAYRLAGLTLPGLANAHSHAFQRALRGRTHAGEGSFWTWREQMYELAATLDPDSCFALSRAAFGEMALAGITCVGEFHYLHHAPDGTPYDDPNAMGRAVLAAARAAGLRLHAARRLLPARRHRALPRPRRRRVGRARRPARRARAGAGRRRDPQRARGRPGRRAGGRRVGRRQAAARARLRAAEGERGHARRPRPHADRRCSPTPARSARTSPRSTPRT